MRELKESVEQKWFVRRRGEVRGPFPAGLVARYIILGRIGASDEVSSDRVEWRPVAQVPQLIPEVVREAARHPDDPEAQEHLRAARRWADERRVPHRGEPTKRLGAGKAYLAVAVIVVVVVLVPLLLPEQAGVREPQCEAPPQAGVVWRDCRMPGRGLANADLPGADLRSAVMRGAVLRAANLAAADLSYADLSLANLRGARLVGAVLVGADLSGANLSHADLVDADLGYADLTGADLSGADLTGARLDHAVWDEGLVCLPGSTGECRFGREG